MIKTLKVLKLEIFSIDLFSNSYRNRIHRSGDLNTDARDITIRVGNLDYGQTGTRYSRRFMTDLISGNG